MLPYTMVRIVYTSRPLVMVRMDAALWHLLKSKRKCGSRDKISNFPSNSNQYLEGLILPSQQICPCLVHNLSTLQLIVIVVGVNSVIMNVGAVLVDVIAVIITHNKSGMMR